MSWSFSVFFLCGMCLAMFRWASHSAWGVAGMTAVGLLAATSLRGLFSGFIRGEAKAMLRTRRLRTAGWIGAISLSISSLFLIEIEDRASGPFALRAKTRIELQAPVAGFLRQVYADEGDCVTAGMVLFRIELPDLSPRLDGKRAERDAAAAQLALLETGTRPEEITVQRERVERAAAARELAAQHLERSRAAHAAESERLGQQIALAQAELKAAESELTRAAMLRAENALSASRFDAAEAQRDVCRAQVQQAIADRRAHDAAGVLQAEQDLSMREREQAEACAALTLMEAGTRPEELAAQQARVRKLEAEIAELEALDARQTIMAPVTGVIVTPHVADKLGHYLAQGAVICEVADTERLLAEVVLTEDAVRRVAENQVVQLRPRGLTSETVQTRVARIAPAAAVSEQAGRLPSTVTVACEVAGVDGRLRPGMTGHARIDTGRRTIAAVIGDRVRHYLRTEFWW